MKKRTEWADFFDDHSTIYDENVFTRDTLSEVDFLTEELRLDKDAHILDIGCGTGRHAIELARRGYRVTGLDVSEGMLNKAREKADAEGVEVTLFCADASDFILNETYDAVICLCEGAFGLLGSSDDPVDQPLKILKNVSVALKPGAPCLFTVLNGYKLARHYQQDDVKSGRFDPNWLTEISDIQFDDQPNEVLRERAFVPTELRLLFNMAGLTVRNIWGGTAGYWGRRRIVLDEIEIMVVAEKS